MNDREKIEILRNHVIRFLESLPDNIKIELKDTMIMKTTDEIIEEINNKTDLGKKYFLQIAKKIFKEKLKENNI